MNMASTWFTTDIRQKARDRDILIDIIILALLFAMLA